MPIQAVDLFCGVGGLSCGLLQAGLNVVAGFDLDETCRYTYEHNNHIPFHQQNIWGEIYTEISLPLLEKQFPILGMRMLQMYGLQLIKRMALCPYLTTETG